jgi:gas vesicle protein
MIILNLKDEKSGRLYGSLPGNTNVTASSLSHETTTEEDTMKECNHYSLGTGAFIAGAVVGAGIALLMTPQSGAKTRDMLRDYVEQAKEELMERGEEIKETLRTAVERGKAAFESAKERGKETLETAKDTVREAGSEAMRNRI